MSRIASKDEEAAGRAAKTCGASETPFIRHSCAAYRHALDRSTVRPIASAYLRDARLARKLRSLRRRVSVLSKRKKSEGRQ
jgi:hypothetical protein